MTPFDASWRRTWANLGREAPHGLKQRLLEAYAEPQRHYHSRQHLSECLALLDDAIDQAEAPGEVEVALWFHDAIYHPGAKDNEHRSADWASSALAAAGLDGAVIERVRGLIMATCHDATPRDPDQQLLVDIDLAILGADPQRFADYDRQIRAEYPWVPGFVYRWRRRQVLMRFLSRPALYLTPTFKARFETRAHDNLRAALR
ncbi:hypothetical protein GCM10028794_07110 [Silanimonas algicola]